MYYLKKVLCLLFVLMLGSNVAFAENLKIGSKGGEVKQVQEKLISKGYGVGKSGADGLFGKNTKEAVIKFQKAHRLVPDGIVGPATKKALGIGPGRERSMRLGDSGKDVQELQITLMKKGCYIGEPGISSGSFGKGTEEAVKSFQKSNSLNEDGIADPATQKKLSSPFAARCKDKAISILGTFDLGKGYKIRVDQPKCGRGKTHFHIQNSKKEDVWIETVDGEESHCGKFKDLPPNWLLDAARNHPKVKRERERLTKISTENKQSSNQGKSVAEKAGEIAKDVGKAVDDNKGPVIAGLAAIALVAASIPVPVSVA